MSYYSKITYKAEDIERMQEIFKNWVTLMKTALFLDKQLPLGSY